MNKAVEFLRECQIFYLATMDENQPRIQPLDAIMEQNGKTYICTSNQNDCFEQMLVNPKVELSGTLGESWIRISGTVAVDPSIEAKTNFLEECPIPIYKPDDGILEVLYFVKGNATIFSSSKEPESFII